MLWGSKKNEIESLLEPARRLVTEELLWEHHAKGLALFRSPSMLVMNQVFFDIQDSVYVSDRFYIKPLIKLYCEDGHIYIMALSRKIIRVLDCTRTDCRLIFSELFPGDEQGSDKFQRYHTGTIAIYAKSMRTPRDQRHPNTTDNNDIIERDFLRQIDQCILECIQDPSSPLVIAAVTRLAGIYRQISQYPNLAEKIIEGNPDNLSMQTLFEGAWPIAERHFQKTRDSALTRYQELSDTEWSSDDTAAIVSAACNARIDKLFIPTEKQIWGDYNHHDERISIYDRQSKNSRELSNFAAVASLRRGAEVYLLPGDHMPTDKPMAAVFRYPRKEPQENASGTSV